MVGRCSPEIRDGAHRLEPEHEAEPGRGKRWSQRNVEAAVPIKQRRAVLKKLLKGLSNGLLSAPLSIRYAGRARTAFREVFKVVI